jgi:hypothetical protein
MFAAASATIAQPQSLSGLPVACKGERISRIQIDASPPFRITGNNIWQRAGRFAAKLHGTTRDKVILRYLALQLGDECTELRRSESERILRAQPFIADATVLAYDDGQGGVILNVVTVDEVSLIIGAGIGGGSGVHSLLLGENNLAGSAILAQAAWKKAIHRDVYSAKVIDYQFLGRPYQLRMEGGRRELGSDWGTELSHPFLTELQRISWRTTAGNSRGYFGFRRPDALSAAILLERSYSDIGGVIRIGPPLGRLALVGGSISFEDESPATTPIIITDTALVPDTSSALINRYTKHQTARLNALWGLRDVNFLRVTGFDALEGTQDIRTGFQLATLLGKGAKFLRGNERDWFASANVYLGAASPISFAAVDVSGEGRRDEEGKWDGILGQGRAALYLKPFNRHTFITDFNWSAGWRQRIPFQLTFVDRDGGLRGFRSADVGGARRIVSHIEDRYLIGRRKQFATFAISGFAEAGKIWAGDSPFGVTTPVYASAGLSLLAASPPQSRRTFRADLAFPVRGPRGHGWEARLTVTDVTRAFRIEPRDITNNRERSVPASVFNWP